MNRRTSPHPFAGPVARAQRGFTLIEVLIVIAILGIISAIALPSYRDYIRKGNRAEARTALLEAAQFMERFYAAANQYTKTDGSMPDLPLRLQVVPSTGAANYSVTVAANTNSFTLTATVQGGMVGDKCGNLVLTNTGQKSRTGTGLTNAECWR